MCPCSHYTDAGYSIETQLSLEKQLCLCLTVCVWGGWKSESECRCAWSILDVCFMTYFPYECLCAWLAPPPPHPLSLLLPLLRLKSSVTCVAGICQGSKNDFVGPAELMWLCYICVCYVNSVVGLGQAVLTVTGRGEMWERTWEISESCSCLLLWP